MYLEYVNYQNVGAIHNLSIRFSFNQNGNPKPIILVGENGTGKSILLSNIVDGFYEIANKVYSNVSVQEGQSTKYYKVISPTEITSGNDYMVAYIRYIDNELPLEYIFKSGNKDWETYKSEQFHDSQISDSLSWKTDEKNIKKVAFQNKILDSTKKQDIENIFSRNVICYFPPGRYEKPNWLSDSYHSTMEFEHIELVEKYTGRLYTPLTVINPVNDNLKWLLDVIVDSRAEIQTSIGTDTSGEEIINYSFSPRFNPDNLIRLLNSRSNVERILSDILGIPVCFELNMRNVKNSGRFKIVEESSGKVVIPTFDSLSTGQMALFNIFATVIRYADYYDVSKSVSLNNITGIVVIDEAELHLHSKLQREVLPKLIQLFPKIQFIITSHSPLFVLGMERSFGSDGYELFQMPDGCKIEAEMFSEFQKAYDYLTITQKFQLDLTSKISIMRNKTLIVTEGKTDWIHLKAAYSHLREVPNHKNLFEDMDIEFLEFTDHMGDSQLCKLCHNTSMLKLDKVIIFVADADNPDVTKVLAPIESLANATEYEKHHKFHGKVGCSKTYSFVLPVPEHRKDTPLISIEHYYTDDQIKREVDCSDGYKRRLYMGGEFNPNGMGFEIHCVNKSRSKCGNERIDIIDADVYKADKASTTNIALPKIKFADLIASCSEPFIDINFESFIPIFKIIREILVDAGVIQEHTKEST